MTRNPYDSPLRDGNRDRLMGLLTTRCVEGKCAGFCTVWWDLDGCMGRGMRFGVGEGKGIMRKWNPHGIL